MAKKKNYAEVVSVEKAKYIKKRQYSNRIEIETDQGRLYIPALTEDCKKSLIEDGWTLLESEYFGADRFDALVLNLMTVRAWITRNRFLTFSGDNWWSCRCGAMVPPYEWGPSDVVIAWRYIKGW